MKVTFKIFGFLLLLVSFFSCAIAQEHPNLTITPKGVHTIRTQIESAPLFKNVLEQTKKEVDAEIAAGIFVPVPKDMAGGYTHERHKKNFFILQKAGNLYQITGDEKYAKYVRDVFLEYAALFPTLELHPTNRSYATGKIFWQCLNDANWLVYCSQAYDCIYHWLEASDRKTLETKLFRPLADFLSVENPQFFNRIHNHSTWANAAVGMIGLVMDDEELIQRALYGLSNDDIDPSMRDNDGGFIKIEGQTKAGFFAQLDFSFSPDGYFTEGPYYLRYAMTPFILFANALSHFRPEEEIFAYRDSILKKSVYALLSQTDWNGQFFPINDSQKGMSWLSREVVSAVDIAYPNFGSDPTLLSIAQLQGRVDLNEDGFIVARDIAAGLAIPLIKKSVKYVDGADGNKGGVAILRSADTEGELCSVFKYSAHGMGHGHFDKLSYSLYDRTGEVVQDYGAARWVNIDQKGGGRYLKENNTWAKQTIAHNTMVINRQTQYNGKVKLSEEHAPELYYHSLNKKGFQVISAQDGHAYPGSNLHRTLIQLDADDFGYPVLIDVFRVEAETENNYELPLWFQGQLLQTNFEYSIQEAGLMPMGEDFGYQHLREEAAGHATQNSAQLTWFNHGRFYTITSYVDDKDELILARLGANDPEFNLRRDPCYIVRKTEQKDALFISTIEPHGDYTPVTEIPIRPYCKIEAIHLEVDTRDYVIFRIVDKEENAWRCMLSLKNATDDAVHKLDVNGEEFSWSGPVHIEKI